MNIKDFMEIPKGYVLVPERTYQKFLNRIEWHEIKEPTISQVAEYLGITVDKIKSDLKEGCPLKVTFNGGRGRGNEKRFLKISVDEYAKSIKKRVAPTTP